MKIKASKIYTIFQAMKSQRLKPIQILLLDIRVSGTLTTITQAFTIFKN